MEEFVKITPAWMAAKYDEYNKKMFGGKMPPCRFVADKATSRWGAALCHWAVNADGEVSSYDFEIKMSNAWDFPERVKENTLAHEMIHIEDYFLNPQHFFRYNGEWLRVRYQAHGNRFFQPEARRLKQFGFDINTYASKEEMTISTMDANMKRKVDARREQMSKIRYALLGATYNDEIRPGQVNVYKLRNVDDARKMADSIKQNDRMFYERWGKHKFEKLEYYDVMSNLCADWRFSKTPDECASMYYTGWEKLIEDMGKGARLCEKRALNTKIDPDFFKNLDKQVQLAENELTKKKEKGNFIKEEQTTTEPIQGGEVIATISADGAPVTEIV